MFIRQFVNFKKEWWVVNCTAFPLQCIPIPPVVLDLYWYKCFLFFSSTHLSSALMRKWSALERMLLVAPSPRQCLSLTTPLYSRHMVRVRLTYHSHSWYRPQMSYIDQHNSLFFTRVTDPIKIKLGTLDGLEKSQYQEWEQLSVAWTNVYYQM